MEWLRRRRESVAIALLIVAGVRLLIGIAAVPLLAGPEAYGSFATAAMFEAARTFDVALVAVTAAVAASCVLSPATTRARALVTAALVETALAILIGLGYGIMGLWSASGGRLVEFAYLLFTLVLPVLALLGLFAVRRRAASTAAPVAEVPGSTGARDGGGPEASEPQQIEPPLPAAWKPDQATGRVWHTADDAARGIPGADWPAEVDAAGWQPIPGARPSPAEHPRHDHP